MKRLQNDEQFGVVHALRPQDPVLGLIAREIDQYLQKSGTSLRSLGAKTGICRKYIAKIREMAVEREKLDVARVFTLLCETSGDEFALDVLKEIGPLLHDKMINGLKVQLENGHGRVSRKNELEFMLDSEEKFITFILAHSSQNGTTLKEVSQVLGEQGLFALDDLVKDDLLEIRANRIYSKYFEEKAMTSLPFGRNLMKSLLRFYRPQNLGMKKNYFYATVERIDQETLEKHQELCREFHRNSLRLLKEGSGKGQIPMFFGLCQDILSNGGM